MADPVTVDKRQTATCVGVVAVLRVAVWLRWVRGGGGGLGWGCSNGDGALPLSERSLLRSSQRIRCRQRRTRLCGWLLHVSAFWHFNCWKPLVQALEKLLNRRPFWG